MSDVRTDFDPGLIERAEMLRERVGFHPGLVPVVDRVVQEFWRHSRHPEFWVHEDDMEHFPDGPFIAAYNHADYDDIPTVGRLLRGRGEVKYVGKVDLVENLIVGAAYTAAGYEPLVRKADDPELENWESVVKPRLGAHLQAGGIVSIAPEGTREPLPKLRKLRSGVADLSASFDVPIVPIGLAGTQLRGDPIAARVGAPLYPPEVDDPELQGEALARHVSGINRRLKTAMRTVHDQAHGLLAEKMDMSPDELGVYITDYVKERKRLAEVS